MDMIAGWMGSLTVWHWVGLGIVLLSVEVMVGTFDLLWIALAAFVTAVFAIASPVGVSGWQGQVACFGVAAVAGVVLGRTLFSGLRRPSKTHPNLNNRMAAMVGMRGEASSAFEHGLGRVRIGDSEWSAAQESDEPIGAGDEIVVMGAQGSVLRVRRG